MRLALVCVLISLAVFVVVAGENSEKRSYEFYPQRQYDYNAAVDQKLFRPTTTSTTVVTVVSTVTCLRSTADCAGRKRRGILEDEEDTNDQTHQYPISPSAVQGIEPTSQPIRESRAADPQVYLVSPTFGYQPQPAYYYNYPLMPFYDQPYVPAALAAGNRLFLGSWTVTSTTTSTTFSITTSTSAPNCIPIAGGTIPRCPA